MSDQSLAFETTGKSARVRRLATIIAALNVILLTTFGMIYFAGGGELELYVFSVVFNTLLFSVLGVLIIARQADHIIGWLFLLIGFALALNTFPYEILIEPVLNDQGLLRPALSAFFSVVYIPAYLIPLTLVLQFFPDGRLPSKRWRPLTAITILTLFAATAAGIAGSLEAQGRFFATSSETGQMLSAAGSVLVSALILASIFGSLAAVVVRFYRSDGIERAQMKWLVYMVILWVPAIVLSIALTDGEGTISGLLIIFYPSALSVAITIGILRYRLFDIDIIIRRTLVYGLLTAILIGIYFGVVLLAQSALVALTGEESPIAIVISTLAIAALFNPLRKRLQAFIDRRFYRRQYDAGRTLEAFAETARDEVDLEQLSGVLMRSVNETMQPEWSGLWLKSGEEL